MMPFTKQHSAYAWVVTCILFLVNLTFHNLSLHSSFKIRQPFTDYFLRLPYSELLEKRLFRSRANRRLVFCRRFSFCKRDLSYPGGAIMFVFGRCLRLTSKCKARPSKKSPTSSSCATICCCISSAEILQYLTKLFEFVFLFKKFKTRVGGKCNPPIPCYSTLQHAIGSCMCFSVQSQNTLKNLKRSTATASSSQEQVCGRSSAYILPTESAS